MNKKIGRKISRGVWVVILSLISSPLSAFTLISNRGKVAYWPAHSASSPVRYRFNTNPSGAFDGSLRDASGTVAAPDEFQPIRDAFTAWTSVAGVDLHVTEDAVTGVTPSSDDGINTIMWIRSAWRSLSFRPPSNALAVTLLTFNNSSGAITNADIYFNAEYFSWAIVDSGSEWGDVDIQNIATHEIGHLFGLDHSSETITESDPDLADATMFYASGPGETSAQTLNADDMRGIRNLYPTSSPAVPTISAGTLTGSSSGEETYSITGTNFTDTTQFVMVSSNGSVADAPSRYFTINSATSATATFDVSGFPTGTSSATMIAFNSPTEYSSYAVQVTGGQFRASSYTTTTGGCELTQREEAPASNENWAELHFGILVGMASMLSLTVLLRRNARGRVRRLYLVPQGDSDKAKAYRNFDDSLC